MARPVNKKAKRITKASFGAREKWKNKPISARIRGNKKNLLCDALSFV